MLTREELEAREEATLAPYAMRSSRSRGRRHPEAEHPYRTVYQRDRDRIIHSTAFRRLQYKTQVFVNHEGDYFRTRLTHTMEAAQISRTVARALRLNEELTEAVSLAHDLGHTPFGHAGEDELDALMKDHGGFEHNRQSLRIVDVLERRYPAFRGLNLSWEVRESLRKHGGRSGAGPEEEAAGAVAGGPCLEAQVVDLADAIAYDNHDIDDGLRAGLIQRSDLDELDLWCGSVEEVRRRYGEVPEAILASQAIRCLIDREVTDLIQQTLRNLSEARPASPEEAQAHPARLVGLGEEVREQKAALQCFLFQRVYRHHRVVRMTTKCRRFLRELFEAYRGDPRLLPGDFQAWAVSEGVEQAVCDYVAGMTDRFALDEYRKLFHPYERP